jgi:hypothetical protein
LLVAKHQRCGPYRIVLACLQVRLSPLIDLLVHQVCVVLVTARWVMPWFHCRSGVQWWFAGLALVACTGAVSTSPSLPSLSLPSIKVCSSPLCLLAAHLLLPACASSAMLHAMQAPGPVRAPFLLAFHAHVLLQALCKSAASECSSCTAVLCSWTVQGQIVVSSCSLN